MKFSDSRFPESQTPYGDYAIIGQAFQEVELGDRLGYDARVF